MLSFRFTRFFFFGFLIAGFDLFIFGLTGFGYLGFLLIGFDLLGFLFGRFGLLFFLLGGVGVLIFLFYRFNLIRFLFLSLGLLGFLCVACFGLLRLTRFGLRCFLCGWFRDLLKKWGFSHCDPGRFSRRKQKVTRTAHLFDSSNGLGLRL